ncbi:amidohydrolase family protein [Monaibacterium marinum]|nr:amidohydrolase family protein [Monaibacterium marinum]
MTNAHHLAPDLRLNGARVLLDDRFEDTSISLSSGLICRDGGRPVDLSGCVLLPGIIDLHIGATDRPLPVLSAQLTAAGTTTAYLAQPWGWQGGACIPDTARTLATALAAWTGGIDLRMQLRVEVQMNAEFNAIARFVRAARVGYVMLLPNQRAHSSQGYMANVSVAQLIAELPPVRLGLHGAADAAMRDMGVSIVEFPTDAPANGDIVLSAATVMQGRGAACVVMASGYDNHTPLDVVRHLVAQGMPLPQAWHLVSAGPARVMGVADRGQIAVGRRSDLVVLDQRDLSLVATVARGRPVWIRPDMVDRLAG